jgi:hypothetical protein
MRAFDPAWFQPAKPVSEIVGPQCLLDKLRPSTAI